MNVVMSFDVEVWCNGWKRLDEMFPSSFQRYVYGRSARGEYALPKTLEILDRYGLKGVFFVEPLFAARFGEQYLREIVEMLVTAGQDVQLHLHPEWADEIRPALIPDTRKKRQHLTMYTLDEQTALIAHGKRMLESASGRVVTAFRAGSFAANRDTYEALARCGIGVDSSLNRYYAISGADVDWPASFTSGGAIGAVSTYPVTVFRDGLGRPRPAQVNGCALSELADALNSAQRGGCRHFVVVSHNFEMLKPGGCKPDPVVVRRFEGLCALLASQRDRLRVGSFPPRPLDGPAEVQPRAGGWSMGWRLAEQALRRFV